MRSKKTKLFTDAPIVVFGIFCTYVFVTTIVAGGKTSMKYYEIQQNVKDTILCNVNQGVYDR